MKWTPVWWVAALSSCVVIFGLVWMPGRAARPALARLVDPPRRVVVALRPPNPGDKPAAQAVQVALARQSVLQAAPAGDIRLLYTFHTLPGFVGQVTPAGLDALQRHPDVLAVSADRPVEAALAQSAALLRANAVWQELGFTGAGVAVAVLDTGIDSSHPDLAPAVVAQHCFNQNGACPPDGLAESDNAPDENGHGTHVASIIAGRGQVAPKGIAPEANLVAVRVLDAAGNGYTSDVLAALDWVVAHGPEFNIKVVNMSFGGGAYSGVCDSVDASAALYTAAVAQARAAGMVVFAASGNSGLTGQMLMPACISGVVSVGGTYDADLGQFIAGGCSEQALTDRVICSSNSSTALDVLAPGALITAAAAGGGQANRTGTSMATAHASGVAALMWQANPLLNPDGLETALKETGVPITDGRTGQITPRIDALAAVSRVSGSQVVTITGAVLLEGRASHQGAQIYLAGAGCSISAGDLPAAVTAADGTFTVELPAGQLPACLLAVQPGYLAGRREWPAGRLGVVTLPGGDINADNVVDILDLAAVAATYGSASPATDLNGSGQVDLLDLVILAGNYKQTGPVPWPDGE